MPNNIIWIIPLLLNAIPALEKVRKFLFRKRHLARLAEKYTL